VYPARLPDFSAFILESHFQHPEHSIDLTLLNIPKVMTPHPPSAPPQSADCSFISGMSFQLEKNCNYPRGVCYVTDFNIFPQARAALKAALDKVVPNPEFRKGVVNEEGIYVRKVPGYVELLAGIPFVIRHTNLPPHLDRHPLAALETRVKYDTWMSIKQYDSSQHLLTSLHAIEQALWGEPGLQERPIWEGSLHRNNRSSKGSEDHPYDGSYSLGITVEECDHGYLGRAKQVANKRQLWRINQVLTHLDLVGDFILSRAILPHELHFRRMLTKVNNAACFGTYKWFSNVQLNYSTGTTTLAETIGKLQGSIHTDPKDSVVGHTLFLLWIRIPKGSS
jgi:hypothetical protein